MVDKNINFNLIWKTVGEDRIRALTARAQELEKVMKDFRVLTSELKVPVGVLTDALTRAGITVSKHGTMIDVTTGKSLKYTDAIEKIIQAHSSYAGVMSMNTDLFVSFMRQGYRFEGLGARIAMTLRNWTQGIHRFKMELLSVMFFGMQMHRLGMNMLGPAMKLYGVTDLISQTLAVIMLPIMQAIYPILLQIAEWLINAPDLVKTLIGAFAIFLIVGGIIATVAAQFGLFIGAVTGAAGVIGTFVATGALILGVVGLIIGAIVLLYLAWKNNWFGIRDIVENVMNFLMSIYDTYILPAFGPVIGAVQMLVATIVGAFTGLMNSIDNILNIIKTILSVFGYFVFEFPGQFIKDPIGAIINLFRFLQESIHNILTNLRQIFRNIWEGILTTTRETWNNIADAVLAPVRRIIDAVNWLREKLSWAWRGVTSFISRISGGGREIRTTIAVPRTQYGGVVTRPSIRLVGEAGPEAIIPLHRYPEFTTRSVTIHLSPTYNISGVASPEDIREIIEEENAKLIDDLKATLRI